MASAAAALMLPSEAGASPTGNRAARCAAWRTSSVQARWRSVSASKVSCAPSKRTPLTFARSGVALIKDSPSVAEPVLRKLVALRQIQAAATHQLIGPEQVRE